MRAGYERAGAREAYDAVQAGEALLVDIRHAALRERDGLIPGALVVERNELEWRLDPRGSHRLPEATGHDLRVVAVCDEGYASSLAAESLHRLGLHRATDLAGGFRSWRAAGYRSPPGSTGRRLLEWRGVSRCRAGSRAGPCPSRSGAKVPVTSGLSLVAAGETRS
ncbi:hypothetical protein SCANM124S_03061 [Streptomyces canus]